MTDVYFSLAWKHAGLISFGWIQKKQRTTRQHSPIPSIHSSVLEMA